MTNPIKPTAPSSAAPVTQAAAAEAAQGAGPVEGAAATSGFRVQGTAAAAGVASAGGAAPTDPLQMAIREVAADIQAGRVPDATAATEAVIIRLVHLRFAHLPDGQRRKMTLHLQELLHRDPFFQSRIEGLLRVAHQPTSY